MMNRHSADWFDASGKDLWRWEQELQAKKIPAEAGIKDLCGEARSDVREQMITLQANDAPKNNS